MVYAAVQKSQRSTIEPLFRRRMQVAVAKRHLVAKSGSTLVSNELRQRNQAIKGKGGHCPLVGFHGVKGSAGGQRPRSAAHDSRNRPDLLPYEFALIAMCIKVCTFRDGVEFSATTYAPISSRHSVTQGSSEVGQGRRQDGRRRAIPGGSVGMRGDPEGPIGPRPLGRSDLSVRVKRRRFRESRNPCWRLYGFPLSRG
jgi:hypothetical protein